MAPLQKVIPSRVDADGNVVAIDDDTVAVTHNGKTTVANTSTAIIAANTDRKRVLLVNQGTNPVFLGFGVAATVNMFPLRAGDPPFETAFAGAINGIVATGTEPVAVYEESR
jgi:hypothetical protein